MDPKTVPVKGKRRAKAEETRRKIIRAAHAEFIGRGFYGATVTEIAKRAEVAPQTVYFVFHTKAELISAVIDAEVMGEDDPRLPQEQPWWSQMITEPDAAEALRIFVRGAAEILSRASAISVVLWAAALTDEEVRRTYQHHEHLQKAGYRQVLETIQQKAPLREDQTLDQLTDVLTFLCGDSTYHRLTAERGWTHEQVTGWLCEAAPKALLKDYAEPAPGRPGP